MWIYGTQVSTPLESGEFATIQRGSKQPVKLSMHAIEVNGTQVRLTERLSNTSVRRRILLNMSTWFDFFILFGDLSLLFFNSMMDRRIPSSILLDDV